MSNMPNVNKKFVNSLLPLELIAKIRKEAKARKMTTTELIVWILDRRLATQRGTAGLGFHEEGRVQVHGGHGRRLCAPRPCRRADVAVPLPVCRHCPAVRLVDGALRLHSWNGSA